MSIYEKDRISGSVLPEAVEHSEVLDVLENDDVELVEGGAIVTVTVEVAEMTRVCSSVLIQPVPKYAVTTVL